MKDRKDYTYRSMRDEREYGPFWYSGVWKVLRPVLVAVTVFVIIAGLLVTGWNRIYGAFLAPVETDSTEEVPFEISSGQSLTRVANNLESAGLIRSRTVFKYYCDFAGMGQKIQTGVYTLNRGMSMTEIADRLASGDGRPLVRNITLIPGETVEEFAEKLSAAGVIEDKAAFLELCRTGKAFSDYYYVSDVLADKKNRSRKYVLEGYLAPDTYEVYLTAKDDEILRKLLSQTEAVFPIEYQERAEELGFTMDQVLTLASLIEKEAKTPDFARVSAVFHNRLKKNMKLQSDVTVKYVTGTRRMVLSKQDTGVDSPYNTFKYTGLPLGPVCNPSPAAIRAALYPDEDYVSKDYLYFCAKDPASGELYFSRTLEEHNQAVAIYEPLWKQFDEAGGNR